MTKLPFEDNISANEKAWDEVTPIHRSHRKGEVEYFKNGGCLLDEFERSHLPEIKGKRVAHLACNCGQDTLSLSNLGAICTGFDQSGKAIEEAISLATGSGISADFVRANILDIPQEFSGKFDVVYISKGVLVWLPDLRILMRNVSSILRSGGRFFLYDQHPFVHMLEEEGKLAVAHDYFDRKPERYSGLDYIGNTTYDASPNYQFMVRLSDISDGIRENGMELTEFLEFEHTFFPQFSGMRQGNDGLFTFIPESGRIRIPQTMIIKAVKK